MKLKKIFKEIEDSEPDQRNEITSIEMSDSWGHSFGDTKIPRTPDSSGTIDNNKYKWYVASITNDLTKVIIADDTDKVLGSASIRNAKWGDGWYVSGIGKGENIDVRGIGILLYEIALHNAVKGTGVLYSDTAQTRFSRGVWAKLATKYKNKFKISGYDTKSGNTFDVRLRTPKDKVYNVFTAVPYFKDSLISDDDRYALYSEDAHYSEPSYTTQYDTVLKMEAVGKFSGTVDGEDDK